MQQVQQGAPLSEALDPTSAVSSSVCRGNNSLGSGQPVGRENERTSQRVPFNAAPKVSPTRGRTECRAKSNRRRKRSRTARKEKLSARQLKRAAARKRREKIQRVFYIHRQLKEKARREKERRVFLRSSAVPFAVKCRAFAVKCRAFAVKRRAFCGQVPCVSAVKCRALRGQVPCLRGQVPCPLRSSAANGTNATEGIDIGCSSVQCCSG